MTAARRCPQQGCTRGGTQPHTPPAPAAPSSDHGRPPQGRLRRRLRRPGSARSLTRPAAQPGWQRPGNRQHPGPGRHGHVLRLVRPEPAGNQKKPGQARPLTRPAPSGMTCFLEISPVLNGSWQISPRCAPDVPRLILHRPSTARPRHGVASSSLTVAAVRVDIAQQDRIAQREHSCPRCAAEPGKSCREKARGGLGRRRPT